jgi:acyl-CoA synthetase (AMP-forming)/AMP-acid ligase II
VDGPVHAQTIPELLDECARRWRGLPAVLEDGHTTSYEQLHADVLDAAEALLGKGIEVGDRVGLWAPNSYRWVVASFALHCAGAVVVPLNTRYRSAEAWDYLVRAEARALLVADGFLGYEHLGTLQKEAKDGAAQLELVVDLTGPGGQVFGGRVVLSWDDLLAGEGDSAPHSLRERMASVRPEDLSDVIFTSGTTGRSKGVSLTHRAPLELYVPYGEIWGLRPGDRYLISLPFFHTGGNKAGILTCLIHGMTIVPMSVYDAETVMQMIERDRITVMNAPPTVYSAILDHPRRAHYDLSSRRPTGRLYPASSCGWSTCRAQTSTRESQVRYSFADATSRPATGVTPMPALPRSTPTAGCTPATSARSTRTAI